MPNNFSGSSLDFDFERSSFASWGNLVDDLDDLLVLMELRVSVRRL